MEGSAAVVQIPSLSNRERWGEEEFEIDNIQLDQCNA